MIYRFTPLRYLTNKNNSSLELLILSMVEVLITKVGKLIVCALMLSSLPIEGVRGASINNMRIISQLRGYPLFLFSCFSNDFSLLRPFDYLDQRVHNLRRV